MPRMIPESPREGANVSERRLFELISAISDHDDWVVFHSLEIARHVEWWQGEADFVVLIPRKGVVVIEVKAPSSVEYTAAGWNLEGTPEPRKDPLKQLDGACRSIRAHFEASGVRADDLPISRLLWFTSISSDSFQIGSPGDLQISDWELAWQDDLTRPAEAISRNIDSHGEWQQASRQQWHEPTWFDGDTLLRATDSLVSRFVAVRSIADQQRERKSVEAELLAEQMFALDLVEDNPHVYFDGPAGTSKSYLVAAAAQRFAARGLRTLVTCVNILMADRLRELIGPNELVTVADLNSLMLEICDLDANPEDASDAWYRTELPERALELLSRADGRATANPPTELSRFEAICADEFQDIAAESAWIDVLESLTLHTVPETPFVFAGDDRQAIMSADRSVTAYEVMKARIPALVHAKLTRNCRLAPDLVESAEAIIGHPLGFRSHRVPKDTPGGVWLESAGGDDVDVLYAALKWLLNFHDPKEVVVLSPFNSQSVAGLLLSGQRRDRAADWLRKQLVRDGGAGQVRWHSIAKFKGLEAEAVVLTDLGEAARAWAQRIGIDYDDLAYVGVTRGKYRCVIIEPDAPASH